MPLILDSYISFQIEFKICLLNITLLQKAINVTNSKTYVFLIASKHKNIMITTEKVLDERKSVPVV